MVIHYFNTISMTGLKPEADPPLLVYADAPLAFPITRKLFQAIGGWKPQIIQTRGIVQLQKAHGSTLPDVRCNSA